MASKKSMKDIWAAMEKAHGSEGLYVGSGDLTTYGEVLSTGSYALDHALGIWGIPRGHIVQYAGEESSGKTLMSLLAIADWQSQDPQNWATFVDAELSFDQSWAAQLGVDLDRLYLIRENSAPKIFDRIIGVPSKPNKKGEITKIKPGILDFEISSGGTGLGIIVLDSIASIQPLAEEASRAGKDNMSLLARFLPPVLRKITPMLTATGVTLIAINQVRSDPSVMFGDPTTTPGGNAFKHACSQMIMFAPIRKKESAIEIDGDQMGHRVRARVDKNKKAPAFRRAEFDIVYTQGVVNKNQEVREIATKYDVIQRPNNRTYELDGEKYVGKDAIDELLKDPDLMNTVLERAKEEKKNYKPIFGQKEKSELEVEDEELLKTEEQKNVDPV